MEVIENQYKPPFRRGSVEVAAGLDVIYSIMHRLLRGKKSDTADVDEMEMNVQVTGRTFADTARLEKYSNSHCGGRYRRNGIPVVQTFGFPGAERNGVENPGQHEMLGQMIVVAQP